MDNRSIKTNALRHRWTVQYQATCPLLRKIHSVYSSIVYSTARVESHHSPSHRRLDESGAALSHGRIVLAARMAVRALLAKGAVLERRLIEQVCFDPCRNDLFSQLFPYVCPEPVLN